MVKHVTLKERLEAATQLQTLPKPPYLLHCSGIRFMLAGDQISFTNDGDFLSLSQAQEVVRILAAELGVKVVK